MKRCRCRSFVRSPNLRGGNSTAQGVVGAKVALREASNRSEHLENKPLHIADLCAALFTPCCCDQFLYTTRFCICPTRNCATQLYIHSLLHVARSLTLVAPSCAQNSRTWSLRLHDPSTRSKTPLRSTTSSDFELQQCPTDEPHNK